MNRHRANWSAMGCGFSNSSTLAVASIEECKKELSSMINFANFDDSFSNIIEALKELRNEND